MAYTYEFKQPDGSYKTQTVDTDMSQSAGYLSGNIRPASTGTVSGTQGINQVNTPTNPIQNQVSDTMAYAVKGLGSNANKSLVSFDGGKTKEWLSPLEISQRQSQTPIVNTNPTNQISTGQNTMFRVNDRQALENLLQQSNVGIQEFEKNYITRNADGSIYLKPAGLKLNTQGLVSQVNTPITRNVDIPTIIPQKTFTNLNSPTSLIDNKIIESQEAYLKALENATSLQAPSETLRQDLYGKTNFEALNKQLIDTDNALRNLEDDIRRQYAGREINESQIQALIAKQSEPILRSRQYLADQVNAIKQQVSEQVADTYNAFNIRWQQAQGNTQLKMQYMNSLQDYANQLYERARNKNVDYLSALNFSLNLPEGEKVTLPDGTTIEGRKVNNNLSAQIETDSFGNSTLVMFDKVAAANALKQGKTPQITKVNLGPIGKGLSYDDMVDKLNRNLTYDPNTGQLVQDVSKATAEQIAEAIKTIESGGNYNAKGGSGEFGAYQFMPSTWYSWAREYQQATGEIPSGTPENQDAVAQFKINQWLSQGLTPEQIFAKWNSGSEVGWENKIGTNKYGINYNVPAYVDKGLNVLRNIVAQTQVQDNDIYSVMANSAGGKDPDATTVTSFEKAFNVLGQIDQLYETFKKQGKFTDITTGDKVKVDLNPILGIINSNNPYATKTQDIKAQLQAIIPNLARGIYGEVGVLTDNDIKNYAQTLPNVKSTEQVAAIVLSATVKNIQRSIENKIKVQAGLGRDVSGIADVYRQYEGISDNLLSQVGLSPNAVIETANGQLDLSQFEK